MEHADREVLLSSNDSQTLQDNDSPETAEQDEPCYKWRVLSASAHSLVQTLIGASVGVQLWFSFHTTPVTLFQLHVGLCTIGYQLLMAHGIICVRGPSWSGLPLRHRQRIHWVLQLSGSVLAIAGTALMIKSKTDAGKSHFTSIHGKLGLAALIFTCASLINGLLSLYVVELRHWIPRKASKMSHVVFGSAAFITSSVCLGYGFNKKSYVEWASQEFAYAMMAVVAIYTTIIILMLLLKIFKKLRQIRLKIC